MIVALCCTCTLFPKLSRHFLFFVEVLIFNTRTGSNTIDFDELKTVLLSCMEESSLKLSDEDIDELTRALFNEADEDGSGEITFDELQAELNKYPDIRDNLTMRYLLKKCFDILLLFLE